MPRSNRNPARSGDVDTSQLLEELVGLQKRTNKLLGKLLETMERGEEDSEIERVPTGGDDSFVDLPQRPVPETPRPPLTYMQESAPTSAPTVPPTTSSPIVPPAKKRN